MTPIVRLCSRPGCGKIATHPPHCEHHANLETQRRRRKDRQAGYNTGHWQTLKRLAKEQAGHRCAECGSSIDITVHINPALNGNHRIAKLADCTVLCRECHGTVDAARANPPTKIVST